MRRVINKQTATVRIMMMGVVYTRRWMLGALVLGKEEEADIEVLACVGIMEV